MSHTFQPVKRVPVYVKVYQAIESDISSGRLPEGSVLPTEAELCQQLEVTRSSIREGIRQLEQAGLVYRGASKKLIVSLPKTGEVAAETSKSLARGGVTFREVWQALAVMYPSAASLAATRLLPEALAELEKIHDDLMLVSTSDHDGIVEAAVRFFQTMAAGLNNRVLLTMLQSLNLLIEASLKQVIASTPVAKDRISHAQARIVAALREKDAKGSAEWMSKHINDLKRGYDVAKIDLNERVM